MDSVTQFVLGAAVGTAVLGRRIGVRRAALTGGLLGTLPDLDVFFPYETEVDRFVEHRGATHSLVMQTLATPVIGEVIYRVFGKLKEQPRGRVLACLAVFLALATHALLDAMTVYGTQLFWPLSKEPFGLGSVFIIDPIYTIPLLAVTLWAFFQRDWSLRFGKALTVALVFSTVYLGWSATGQKIAEARADAALASAGIEPSQRLGTPMPFSTLFWRVIAMDGPHHYAVYVPLLGGQDAVTAYRYSRLETAAACGNGAAQRLAKFSQGYFEVRRDGDQLLHSDLRMGIPPTYYVFQYVIAEEKDGMMQPVEPTRVRGPRNGDGDMDWLWASILGGNEKRPADVAAWFDLSAPVQVAAANGDGKSRTAKAC